MRDSIEYISQHLKKARKHKGLSQRELSAKSGVPQGHISKIENGNVDLRLSSLVALARVLELELALVPRKSVGAVNVMIGNALCRAENEPPRPAYTLDEDEA